MTVKPASEYNFETQLELGEMLLNLGRIDEARNELEKARELNEIGAYSTTDESVHAAHLERLSTALERVESIGTRTQASSKRMWALATTGLLLALIGVSSAWILSRNADYENTVLATNEAELASFQLTESASYIQSRDAESTRTWEMLGERDQRLYQFAQEVTRISLEKTNAENIARIEATATVLAEQLEAQTNPEPTAPAATESETPEAETDTADSATTEETADAESEASAEPDATETSESVVVSDSPLVGRVFQVNTGAVNLRSGPGPTFSVIRGLISGSLAILLDVSEDDRWYNVIVEGGQVGWIRADLLALIEDASTPVPRAAPVIVATAVAVVPTAVPVVPTAEPTAVPSEPTAAPTDIPATSEPPVVVATVVPTQVPQVPQITQAAPTQEPVATVDVDSTLEPTAVITTTIAPEATPTIASTSTPDNISEDFDGQTILVRLIALQEEMRVIQSVIDDARDGDADACRQFEASYKIISEEERDFNNVPTAWSDIVMFYTDALDLLTDRGRPAALSCERSNSIGDFNYGLATEAIYDTLDEIQPVIVDARELLTE